jgi:hypothetical protein
MTASGPTRTSCNVRFFAAVESKADVERAMPRRQAHPRQCVWYARQRSPSAINARLLGFTSATTHLIPITCLRGSAGIHWAPAELTHQSCERSALPPGASGSVAILLFHTTMNDVIVC